MSKTELVEFYVIAVKNCIEESKFYEEELSSAAPMNKQMVVSLDQKIKDTHEVYEASIGLVPEEERIKTDLNYKAIRKRLLKGVMARCKAIICPAQPSVAEPFMIETEDATSLPIMAVSTKSGSEIDSNKLELFASDNDEEEKPISRMSLLKCPESYQPITFANDHRASKKVNPFSRERRSYTVEKRRTNEHNLFGKTTQKESAAVRGRNVKQQYVWVKQIPARRPVWGVPYPPMADARPMKVELKRNDPDIIGMAEIWTQKVGNRDPKKCAHCKFKGNHRMYGCAVLQKEGIQRRWYHALKCGVCLNCLMIGHSSFTCKDQGCCKDHGTRHSTFLCERSFNNKL